MALAVLKAGTCCIIIPENFQGLCLPFQESRGTTTFYTFLEMIDQTGTHVLVTQQKGGEPRGLTQV